MALFYRLRSYPPNLVVGALHQVAEAAFPRKETFSTYRLNVISPRAPASACSCAICSVQTCRILYRRTPQTLWQSVWERPEDSLGHSFGMTSVSAGETSALAPVPASDEAPVRRLWTAQRAEPSSRRAPFAAFPDVRGRPLYRPPSPLSMARVPVRSSCRRPCQSGIRAPGSSTGYAGDIELLGITLKIFTHCLVCRISR